MTPLSPQPAMIQRTSLPPALLPVVAAVALSSACVTTPVEEPEKPADPEERVPVFAAHTTAVFERTWTEFFGEETALIAQEILVDGPADLLDHVAVLQDPEVFDVATRTIPDGLRQEITVKPGIQGREVRAQLDAWALVATRRLIVLQRPGDAPVRVRAVGEAALLPTQGTELRSASLEFTGEHGRR